VRFKLDENIASELAAFLRGNGHDASTVTEQRLSGADDVAIAAVVRDEGRVLVTFDLDFSDIRRYPPQNFPGLIVLRIARQDPEWILAVFQRLLERLPRDGIDRELWIVEDVGIRRRTE
jgi:predicted nuclease of predicted toxin-antitoxin system